MFQLLRHRHTPIDKGNLILEPGDITRSLFERLLEYKDMETDFRSGLMEPKKIDYLHIDQYGPKLFLDEYTKYLNDERRYLNAMGLKRMVDDLFTADKAKLLRETTSQTIV